MFFIVSSRFLSVGVLGTGLGISYAASTFPVLVPLNRGRQPAAVSFQSFCRNFGQVCGVTIPGVVLNARLADNLPSEFIQQVGGSASGAFAAIPSIKYL